MNNKMDIKEGYIIDYISGEHIKATPEEIEAVQVFSKILVEDYEYPSTFIQTRPQYRVKVRPSDTKKEYPIDIGVFTSDTKNDNTIQIIVECKKKNRTDGLEQLKDYLRFSSAELGVWFNGNQKLFIRKYEKSGKVLFQEIPNIPKYKQRIEDIGRFYRKDLKPAINLKSIFKTIRNYLAANNVGATRDEVLAQELINIIFCKIYDEKFTRKDDIVTFRAGIEENPEVIAKRIQDLFVEVKKKYNDVLDKTDVISLDAKSIVYVVGELQNFCLTDSSRDAIGDAFEVFIDHALKGGQGQFFTPRNVVKMVVEMVDPSTDDKILDPACGSGGFIIEAMRYVWDKIEKEGKRLNWPDHEIEIEKQKVAIKNLRGIDKDYFLSKVAKAYMALLGDGRGGIFCENSLEIPKNWSKKTQTEIKFESFDVIITNPPFGAKLPVTGNDILEQYEFGLKWTYDKKEKSWIKGKLKDKEAPQILFIERCLQLLAPGGKLGIVLPDGILGNDKLGYIRNSIINKAKILAIVDVPIETFMPHTSTKTSILILQKNLDSIEQKDYQVFMAIAETCGHNRRGDIEEDDDISKISKLFKEWEHGK
ncbi:MAG: restriction endonuclease subunit M [Flavipsychrobacter sp.]